jgi:hypothetical protein
LTTTIDERVAAGAAFLDEHDPDWWREDVPNAIDLDALRLESGSACILGQRCPLEVLHNYCNDAFEADRYWAYAELLSGLASPLQVDFWAQEYGFVRSAEQASWDDLTLAWWVLINERRKLAADGQVA